MAATGNLFEGSQGWHLADAMNSFGLGFENTIILRTSPTEQLIILECREIISSTLDFGLFQGRIDGVGELEEIVLKKVFKLMGVFI